jgi:Rad3-related DNA helicase
VFSRYLNHFPKDYNPSPQQVKLIKNVEKAFNKGKKFVIACAPTGSGKSFLAKTLAGLSNPPDPDFVELVKTYKAYKQDFTGNYIHEAECLNTPAAGAFALTITKSLQDQYLKLFADTNLLKGKTNYICDVDQNFDVETAPCLLVSKLKDDCWEKNRCPYYNARNDALISQFAALNYKMFLSLPKHLKRKNFLICDEASELEDELVKQFSAEVNYERLKNYGVEYHPLTSESYEKARNWVNILSLNINEKIDTLISKASKKQNSLSQPERIKLLYLKNVSNSLSSIDLLWNDCEFVVDRDSKKATFTPLKIDKLSKNVFDYGDNVLLMSATIIDHKNFAKTLGITDYEYVEVDSDFEASKSPIHVSSKHKLNYKNLKVVLPDIIDQIKQIVEFHKNDKGIIHTHTQEITNLLRDKLQTNRRYLFRDATSKNEDILSEHFKADIPTILVSPSLSYGIDLKDDLARFQIIVKLPFPPLSSKRIKRLFDIDKNWYENKMLNSIVQACGRATRSKHDYSTTYILDGNIVNTLKRTKDKLPRYFIDRVC